MPKLFNPIKVQILCYFLFPVMMSMLHFLVENMMREQKFLD